MAGTACEIPVENCEIPCEIPCEYPMEMPCDADFDCEMPCQDGQEETLGKRQRVKKWFKDAFDGSSSCSNSSQSSACDEMPCYDDFECEIPCPEPCPPQPKFKTCYRTVTEQVKVPCKKTIKVPKQITCYRRKVITECVPTTKKVWKRVEVPDTKTIKKPVKECYTKTIMVPKVVESCKTVNVTKKVPYTVCFTEKIPCKPLVKTTCKNVCVEEPVCKPAC